MDVRWWCDEDVTEPDAATRRMQWLILECYPGEGWVASARDYATAQVICAAHNVGLPDIPVPEPPTEVTP